MLSIKLVKVISLVFALVDVNSFYASCEAVFRPDLQHKPIIVLSNNDGCIIARNAEAKALGIKMAEPYYQFCQRKEAQQVTVFSSNYALYADMSQRVMTILESLSPATEIYSIDEAFLNVTTIGDLAGFGHYVRRLLQQQTGLTVGVGFGPTKTLAKLANYAAKKWPATGGIVDLSDKQRQEKLFAIVPVEQVWGVGRNIAKHLQQMGVKTVLDLVRCNTQLIRKNFHVTMERTVRELRGEPCLSLAETPTNKQQIICSRSFSEKITQYNVMKEAICAYAERASEKLREERQFCQQISVFIRTSAHNPYQPYYSNTATGRLPVPSNDSRDIIGLAQRVLESIWQKDKAYLKAGIILNDFSDRLAQFDLFAEQSPRKNSELLMATIDKINHSGKGKIWFAGQGISPSWKMKREMLSPAYTTSWCELPLVN